MSRKGMMMKNDDDDDDDDSSDDSTSSSEWDSSSDDDSSSTSSSSGSFSSSSSSEENQKNNNNRRPPIAQQALKKMPAGGAAANPAAPAAGGNFLPAIDFEPANTPAPPTPQNDRPLFANIAAVRATATHAQGVIGQLRTIPRGRHRTLDFFHFATEQYFRSLHDDINEQRRRQKPLKAGQVWTMTWSNKGPVAENFAIVCDQAKLLYEQIKAEATALGGAQHVPDLNKFMNQILAYLISKSQVPETALGKDKLQVKLKDWEKGGTRYTAATTTDTNNNDKDKTKKKDSGHASSNVQFAAAGDRKKKLDEYIEARSKGDEEKMQKLTHEAHAKIQTIVAQSDGKTKTVLSNASVSANAAASSGGNNAPSLLSRGKFPAAALLGGNNSSLPGNGPSQQDNKQHQTSLDNPRYPSDRSVRDHLIKHMFNGQMPPPSNAFPTTMKDNMKTFVAQCRLAQDPHFRVQLLTWILNAPHVIVHVTFERQMGIAHARTWVDEMLQEPPDEIHAHLNRQQRIYYVEEMIDRLSKLGCPSTEPTRRAWTAPSRNSSSATKQESAVSKNKRKDGDDDDDDDDQTSPMRQRQSSSTSTQAALVSTTQNLVWLRNALDCPKSSTNSNNNNSMMTLEEDNSNTTDTKKTNNNQEEDATTVTGGKSMMEKRRKSLADLEAMLSRDFKQLTENMKQSGTRRPASPFPVGGLNPQQAAQNQLRIQQNNERVKELIKIDQAEKYKEERMRNAVRDMQHMMQQQQNSRNHQNSNSGNNLNQHSSSVAAAASAQQHQQQQQQQRNTFDEQFPLMPLARFAQQQNSNNNTTTTPSASLQRPTPMYASAENELCVVMESVDVNLLLCLAPAVDGAAGSSGGGQ